MPAGVEIGFEIEKKGGIEHSGGDSLRMYFSVAILAY